MKTLRLLFLLLTIFFLLISFYWIFEARIQNKTQATQQEVSSETSYVFTTPYCAQIASEGRQRITIFCLNEEGRGVANLNVRLSYNPNIQFFAIQEKTDDKGKAIFDIRTQTPFSTSLEIACGAETLDSKANVCFE